MTKHPNTRIWQLLFNMNVVRFKSWNGQSDLGIEDDFHTSDEELLARMEEI